MYLALIVKHFSSLGYIFVATTIISLGAIIFLLVSFIMNGAPIFAVLICLLASIFYVYAYISVGLSDPGILSTGMQPGYETKMNQRYCTPCKIVKPNRTRHCLLCDVCIDQHDHHCPWIGKCVGSGNMNRFRQFLCSVTVLLAVLFLTAFVGLKPETKTA